MRSGPYGKGEGKSKDQGLGWHGASSSSSGDAQGSISAVNGICSREEAKQACSEFLMRLIADSPCTPGEEGDIASSEPDHDPDFDPTVTHGSKGAKEAKEAKEPETPPKKERKALWLDLRVA